jgi:hypothetical protein
LLLKASATAFEATEWIGLGLEVSGNDEQHDIRLRTDQLTRPWPWQSFRTEFTELPEWQTHQISFDTFTFHKTDAINDKAQLRRMDILAIGQEFKSLVAVAAVRLYQH